jgi:hypothetical protein
MIILLIFFNTILLSLDRYPIDEAEVNVLETMNSWLTWAFLSEMIIKLIGLGVKEYSQDRFNLFDAVIVIISIVEIILEELLAGSGVTTGGAISAFRGIRLLRVFKLARSWKSFQVMLGKIAKSLKDISNFTILLVLFMFTYSLLGMELFAYGVKYDYDGLVTDPLSEGEFPRSNFNSFIFAFTTIFVVLIGEDWN